MFNDNVDDIDNDDYFDNNVEANVEESMLVNTNAMVGDEEKKRNQIEIEATKQCDEGD